MKDKRPVIALIAVFLFSCVVRLHMVHSQVPEGVIIDWGDNWSFLTVIKMINRDKHLPVQDLFFGGIPYVYPPLSLITYAILHSLIPVSYIFFSNNIAPIMGSLTVFGVYYLAHKISGDRWTGVVAAYLSIFPPRYMALSSIPIPEMFGHLQAPVVMYLAYLTAKTKSKNIALLAGLCGATLFLNHHLTSAILVLTVVIYFVLLALLRLDFSYIKLLVVFLAVSFLLSSPWWFDTINKNIMNLVVREQEYAVPPYRDYVSMMSPYTFYLGVAALVYFAFLSVVRKNEGVVLIFTWSGFTLLATQSRHIVKILLEEQVNQNPNLLLVLAPIYGERYFDYMAQPYSIMIALALVPAFLWFVSWAAGRVRKKSERWRVRDAMVYAAAALLVYPTASFGFGWSNPVTSFLNDAVEDAGVGRPYLTVSNWALWRMQPDVNDSAEYAASLWMRDNLDRDANIVVDYPSGEVVSAGALRRIVGGAELRVTVDVVGVYNDILDIYYTDDIDEAIGLMVKRNATHVYISDRIIRRGWLPITSRSRWPSYSIGSGMRELKEQKFVESDCFNKIYDKDNIRLYELVC